MKLVLNGKKLLELSGEINPHRLSLKAQVSYPTVERYINRPEDVKAIDLTVLGMILTTGLGLDPEQALALPLSALFDLVE